MIRHSFLERHSEDTKNPYYLSPSSGAGNSSFQWLLAQEICVQLRWCLHETQNEIYPK